MKKGLLVSLVCIMIFLAGCSEEKGIKENTIKTADLTQREKDVLSMASDFYFMYDFHAHDAFKDVSIWAEKYENGKKTEVVYGPITVELTKGEGYLYFTKNRDGENTGTSLFNLGVGDGEGGSSANFTDKSPGEKIASLRSDFLEDGIPIEGKHILGAYGYTDKNSVRSFSLNLDKDLEEQLERLEDYELVYVFMAEFKK